MMLKVMVLLPISKVGGAEKIAAMIVLLGNRFSLDVDLYCLDPSAQGLVSYGVNAEKMNIPKLIRVLIEGQYDVVFTTHFKVSILVALCRLVSSSRTKQVARESTVFRDRFGKLKSSVYMLGYKFFYTHVDAVIFQSEYQCSRFSAVIPRSVTRCILLNPYEPLERSESIPPYRENKVIIGCGRLIYEKGFDLLIQAYHELGLADLGYRLIILGDGPCFSELSSLIRKLKLDSTVSLEGFVQDPIAYFSAAELCVVSSRIEGFPNVLLEMIASSSRVISTKCAGSVAEIGGILLCEPDNLSALKDSLRMACVDQRESLFNQELSSRSLLERNPEQFVSQFGLLCEDVVDV